MISLTKAAGPNTSSITARTKPLSRQTNQVLGRSGRLWEEETYDRIIRDEEHLYRVVQYIGANFAKAGLPEAAWHRWIHPAWQQAGWRFNPV